LWTTTEAGQKSIKNVGTLEQQRLILLRVLLDPSIRDISSSIGINMKAECTDPMSYIMFGVHLKCSYHGCLTAACKALSLANAKGKGTNGLVIGSLD
jgi:hypothetical protein